MGIHLVTELCIFAYRHKIAVCFFSSVLANSGNAICGAIRACPNYIRLSKLLNDVCCRDR